MPEVKRSTAANTKAIEGLRGDIKNLETKNDNI
jgi:hypothetical protein